MTEGVHRHLAHPPPVRRHNVPVVLHVTVCAEGREPVLANADAQAALVAAWREATHWMTGWYVIMPDHVHLLCVPGVIEYPTVRRWAGYWKRLAGSHCGTLKGAFQADCWDTQMRSREQYDEKLAYMMANPVRARLVEATEAWPYRGRVHDVGWR
jgi:putative transposase